MGLRDERASRPLVSASSPSSSRSHVSTVPDEIQLTVPRAF